MAAVTQLVTFLRNLRLFFFVFKKAKKIGCALAATTYPDEEGIKVLRNADNYLQIRQDVT